MEYVRFTCGVMAGAIDIEAVEVDIVDADSDCGMAGRNSGTAGGCGSGFGRGCVSKFGPGLCGGIGWWPDDIVSMSS
jgi:hypothetical protein